MVSVSESFRFAGRTSVPFTGTMGFPHPPNRNKPKTVKASRKHRRRDLYMQIPRRGNAGKPRQRESLFMRELVGTGEAGWNFARRAGCMVAASRVIPRASSPTGEDEQREEPHLH
jgi:hypothetical protein